MGKQAVKPTLQHCASRLHQAGLGLSARQEASQCSSSSGKQCFFGLGRDVEGVELSGFGEDWAQAKSGTSGGGHCWILCPTLDWAP